MSGAGTRARIGLVGARGYTGRELLALVAGHPGLELACATSRELAGRPIREQVADWPDDRAFEALGPADVAAAGLDACVLALPNGASGPWVDAIDAASPDTVLVDLSSDHRFDAAWRYGQPERRRDHLRGARRIANPGCYATAMQLAIDPLLDRLDGAPSVFGVSGYSGAGSKPSPSNDPAVLRDNLVPYRLTDHTHEREVVRHLDHPVHFMPHVAHWFRGITLTVGMSVSQPTDVESVRRLYAERWGPEPLVRVVDDVPRVDEIVGRHDVAIGGFSVSASGRRVVVVATIDNLLKGAATQALQNINLGLGLPELAGVPS